MKTIIILSLFFMVMAILGWLLMEWGKRVSEQAHVYDRIYCSIQLAINCDHVSYASYKNIKKRLEWLEELPYKDSERTSVLRDAFSKKYAEFNQPEEFDPSAIFAGE